MSRRRQPDDQQPRRRIAKAWDGFRPIDLVAIGSPFLASDVLTVCAQALASFAGDDGVANGGEPLVKSITTEDTETG
jgi:hypothetical protein